VTNRDIEGIEKLSTSVTITKDGHVTKIQRVLAQLKNKFYSKEFPFDTQTLEVITSSSKYMASDVELVADSNSSAVAEDAFEDRGFKVDSHEVVAYKEKLGPSDKSRGKMIVKVQRGLLSWRANTVPTASTMLLISYLVFWLPMLPPYAMPRASVSMIAFLATSAFQNAFLAGVKGLPGLSWGGVIFQTWTWLSFGVVVLNVVLEYIYHIVKLPELATQIHSEMKVGFLLLMIAANLVSQVYFTRFFGIVIAILGIIGVIVNAYKRCQASLASSGQKQLEPWTAVKEYFVGKSTPQPEGEAGEKNTTSDEKPQSSAPTADQKAQSSLPNSTSK